MLYSLYDNIISPVFTFMLKQNKTKKIGKHFSPSFTPSPGKTTTQKKVSGRVPVENWGMAIIQQSHL